MVLKHGLAKFKRSWQRLRHWQQRKTWPEGSIVYYAGSIYGWIPPDFNRGLGGSELAALSLAREWAQLGYSVTVFNDCGAGAGVYEGVNYRPYTEFNPFDHFDTLIIWRYPCLLYTSPSPRDRTRSRMPSSA